MEKANLVTRISNYLQRGPALPETRETRGRFLFGLGPFNLNRRARRVEQLQAYQGWVAAAVNQISSDMRQAQWQIGTSTGPAITDFDPFEGDLPQVFRTPLRMETFGHQIELLTKHLDTTGECFWYIVGDPGRVDALSVIFPNHIQYPVYSEIERRFIAWKFDNGVTTQDLPFEDVIWTRRPHPLEAFRGASPVEQFALNFDMDQYAKAYGADLLESGGMPPGVISLEGEVTPVEAKIIQSRWKRQRQDDPANIAVLGKNAVFDKTGASLADLAFLDLARMNRDQILGIYGVPASKLGLIEDVNRASADAVNREYARNVLMPRHGLFAESINTFLLPLFPELAGMEFRFINPVEPDQEFNLEKANTAFERGVISINTYLMETGREPQDGADELFKRAGTFREGLEPEEPPLPPGPNEPGGNAPPNNEDEDSQRDRDREDRIMKAIASVEQKINVSRETSEEPPNVKKLVRDYFDEISKGEMTADAIVLGLKARGLFPDNLPLSERQLRDASNRFLMQQDSLEREMKSALRRLFSAEKSAVTKAIMALKRPPRIESREVTGIMAKSDPWEVLELQESFEENGDKWTMHTFAYDPIKDGETINRDLLDNIFNRQRQSWVNSIRRFFNDGFERGWDLLKEDTGRDLLDFDRERTDVEMRAAREAPTTVDELRATTRRRVAAIVARGIAAEFSVERIAQDVGRLYDTFRGSRVDTVARTQTAQYVNRGKTLHEREANQVLGVQIRNTWSAILDENTRAAHEVANGQIRRLGNSFAVGGEELDHPHDPDGSAGNVINCRCTLVSEIINS